MSDILTDITALYQEWQQFAAEAQVGRRPLSEAKGARDRFTDMARDIKSRLPFKTDVCVRAHATARVDIAEHLAPKQDARVLIDGGKPFERNAGEAFCNRSLIVSQENAGESEGDLIVLNRRSPSCLRCLLIADAVAANGYEEETE